MRLRIFHLAIGLAAFSGCSETDSEEPKPAEPIVLSIDGTAVSLKGVSGGDIFHALSRLAALKGPVELRVRDHAGEMIFRIQSEANIVDGFIHGDLMSIEIRSQSVAINNQELSEQEFVAHLKPYVETAKMVGGPPLIIVFATDSSRMDDCLKYLRMLYDGGVNSFIVSPHR